MPDPDNSLDTGPPGTREFDADDGFELVETDATCYDCAHFAVCGFINRMVRLTDEVANTDDPPIQPDALAKICDDYDPER